MKKRTFVIYDEPHLADPAWLFPIAETIAEPMDIGEGNQFRIVEPSEIIELASNIARKQLEIAYETRGLTEALKTMGITHDEYIKRKRAEYEARKTEE